METKICAHCGNELPLSDFRKTKWGGFTSTCNKCMTEKRVARMSDNKEKEKADARNLRIQDFTPRELMVELKRRGYEFTMKYTETHIISSDKL